MDPDQGIVVATLQNGLSTLRVMVCLVEGLSDQLLPVLRPEILFGQDHLDRSQVSGCACLVYDPLLPSISPLAAKAASSQVSVRFLPFQGTVVAVLMRTLSGVGLFLVMGRNQIINNAWQAA